MATTTPNFGWAVPTSTDLVKDGAVAIETLGDSIDASLVDLKGGTTGQVLAKASGTDMDFSWVAQDDSNAIQNAIVDAKGDLIAASANDTPARLAVGNNGETLVADSSTSTGLRYNPQNPLVNPIIGGGMDIWQRGTSIAIAASGNGYTADRWCAASQGANLALTISRQATGDTTNLPNVQYCARVQRNSGQTGTSPVLFVNSLESVNAIPFAGKTVTMSFYARKGADFSTSGITSTIIMGTGTDQNRAIVGYTGETSIAGSATLTTTWQRFAITGTIAATATEFATYFSYTPTGTASTNDYFEITGVQIDIGTYTASTAPSFRRSGGTIQGELAACQRYYFKHPATGANSPINTGSYYTSSNVGTIVPFPVTMRVAPTFSVATGTDYYQAVRNGGLDGFNSFTQDSSNTLASILYNNSEASGTAGHAALIIANNASASIAWSAEL
jgi:hypothetical protein